MKCSGLRTTYNSRELFPLFMTASRGYDYIRFMNEIPNQDTMRLSLNGLYKLADWCYWCIIDMNKLSYKKGTFYDYAICVLNRITKLNTEPQIS